MVNEANLYVLEMRGYVSASDHMNRSPGSWLELFTNSFLPKRERSQCISYVTAIPKLIYCYKPTISLIAIKSTSMYDTIFYNYFETPTISYYRREKGMYHRFYKFLFFTWEFLLLSIQRKKSINQRMLGNDKHLV